MNGFVVSNMLRLSFLIGFLCASNAFSVIGEVVASVVEQGESGDYSTFKEEMCTAQARVVVIDGEIGKLCNFLHVDQALSDPKQENKELIARLQEEKDILASNVLSKLPFDAEEEGCVRAANCIRLWQRGFVFNSLQHIKNKKSFDELFDKCVQSLKKKNK